MSSFRVLTFLLLLAISHSQADESEEEKKKQAKEMLRGMAQECKQSEGATDEDVEAMLEDKMPETTVQKCLHSCMQQQFTFSDGQKFLKDGFLQICEMIFQQEEEKDKMMETCKEVADECDGTANEDRCELSVDIMNCVRTSLEKRGIKKER